MFGARIDQAPSGTLPRVDLWIGYKRVLLKRRHVDDVRLKSLKILTWSAAGGVRREGLNELTSSSQFPSVMASHFPGRKISRRNRC